MKSIVRLLVLASLVVVSATASAETQIPWAADFRSACELAAEQRRLVLLHFYNDNCEPCVRVEQNVFSQPQVAESVIQNYVPVKVHAGKNPQLATRYQVSRWPTDVMVTPSGLEVYRAISPQKPAEYINLLNQVAQQTGTSGRRQWNSKLDQPGQGAAAGAAAGTIQAGTVVPQAGQQTAAPAQDAFGPAQQRWSAAVQQYQAASDQARAPAADHAQPALEAGQELQQRSAAAAQQWSQQATDAMRQYEQQSGDAYRRFQDQAAPVAQQLQEQAQGAHQTWQGATNQFGEANQSAGQQFSEPHRTGATFGPQSWTPSGSSLRSPFMPADAPAANGPSPLAPPGTSSAAPASPPPKAAEPEPAIDTQPRLPTENPWYSARQSRPTAVSASEQPILPQQSVATMKSQPERAASPSAAASASAPPTYGGLQLVPASQAPPIALDGFCPVTLVETVVRDARDRSAWKKGDPRFGVIHLGRTYLFASEAQQQRFLANPEAYAPVLAGYDAVRYAERGELVEGKRAYGWLTPDGRLYLFADEDSFQRFNRAPGAYAAVARQAMLRSQAESKYR